MHDKKGHLIKQPAVIAISGVKNSGKTTLIERILPKLHTYGLTVAVIKHDGHTLPTDPINTDTGRYMEAGAYGTAIFDGAAYQVMKRNPVNEHALIQMFPEADLILIEGLKYSSWPKIEIVRGENSASLVCSPETLLAVVTDISALECNAPHIALDDIDGVVQCILQYMGRI